MRAHFAKGGRFLEFDIARDPPEAIRDFVAEDYAIDVSHWHTLNTGRERRKKVRWRPEAYILPALKRRFDL